MAIVLFMVLFLINSRINLLHLFSKHVQGNLVVLFFWYEFIIIWLFFNLIFSIHGFITHRFSNQSSSFVLKARARQFSSFILLVFTLLYIFIYIFIFIIDIIIYFYYYLHSSILESIFFVCSESACEAI